MILTFDDEIVSNARLLSTINANVAQEICEVSLQFLRYGLNAKVCSSYAQKLDIELELVKLAFEAVMFIISQATRFSLTESDFEESLSTLQLHKETMTSLVNVYQENKNEIRQILAKMDNDSNSVPIYSNVEWRCEVLLSTRMCREQMKPRIILRFEFYLGNGKKSYVTLQCDAANLMHLHENLEEAFADSRSQHVLKMLRLLK